MGMIRLLIFAWLVFMTMRWFRGFLGTGGAGGPRVSSGKGARPTPPSTPAGPSAHEVLGVQQGATPEEIRAAYQKLVQQYHPDRVDDLGPELREVAERRTKEINAAYNELKRT
jgi:DnaJ-domain-containing protein 1